MNFCEKCLRSVSDEEFAKLVWEAWKEQSEAIRQVRKTLKSKWFNAEG